LLKLDFAGWRRRLTRQKLLRNPAAIHIPRGAANVHGALAAQKQRQFTQLLRGDKLT
jgi:hypothetical protein